MTSRAFVSMLLLGGLGYAASGGVIWDESVDGDLSGDVFMPNEFDVDVGSNLVSGDIGGARTGPGAGDFEDVFVVRLKPGFVLERLTLVAYETGGVDDFTTINVIQGASWDGDFENPDYIGPARLSEPLAQYSFVFDTLDLIEGSNGIPIGNLRPFDAPAYVFSIRDSHPGNRYTLDFVVSPSPSSAGVLAMALGLSAGRGRR